MEVPNDPEPGAVAVAPVDLDLDLLLAEDDFEEIKELLDEPVMYGPPVPVQQSLKPKYPSGYWPNGWPPVADDLVALAIAQSLKPIEPVVEPMPVIVLEPGRYVPGENQCPNCEQGPTTLDEWSSLREVDGIWLWFCCYSLCKDHDLDDWHVYPDEDQCDECALCTQNCECLTCPGCDEKTQELCSKCEYCEGCCECSTCGYCNSKVDSTCENCEQCDSCCSCHYCNSCDETTSDWCGDCDYCSSCCNCNDNDDCDCGECTEGDGHNRAASKTTPWSNRGQIVTVRRQHIDHNLWKTVDPVQSMAEFYLLSYMTPPIVIHTDYDAAFAAVSQEASMERAALVARIDPVFVKYLDMAIGGEVRHHTSIRSNNVMSGDRDRAWGEWFSIREQVGLQALLDAAFLFREMGGNYGGVRWATATMMLHDRLTSKIPPWLFVDRIFTMQHNGGPILDKVVWANKTDRVAMHYGVGLCKIVGDAHAAREPNLPFLQLISGSKVNELFRSWWKARNRALMGMNQRPLILPDSRKDIVRRKRSAWDIVGADTHREHFEVKQGDQILFSLELRPVGTTPIGVKG